MNLLPILLLYLTTLLPFTTALSPTTLQNCHTLERLNNTIQRVSPLLDRLSTPASTNNLHSIKALLASSHEKVHSRLSNCSDASVSMPTRSALEQNAKRADDGECSLIDVLDQLVDTLECVVSFATGLLGTILDGVFGLLEGVVRVVERLLD
ncbi:hypothetical protein BO94DRAFT_553991 [Aspergillus sclerotioniger CBS 115572]|uniref:Cell wall protein n=1 Tax=Aspergillus sclerotioniger CBS 115572 TaxID=1450535 RepID=A0A317X759_9EURO|nr:hypothetical protein BO94DRAFT_553991 [Aspergillus sclerotioniger CBS 115572]PWY94175.1 hypothetical protein BO94DRAFT_553991 [Aspergillus sclerotioniger CBS 115572]